nr:hypothetical protein [Tanacetum cinerariifolium]
METYSPPMVFTHMMTARKRVGPLPTYCLAVRHSVNYSSSDLFTSDDSSIDLPSDSSLETSSDSYLDALSNSSSGHSSLDHSSPEPPSVRADLLPLPKRIRSFNFATDLKDCSNKSSEPSVPRETSLRGDVIVRGSDEPYSEHDIDPEIQAEINECIAYVDALRANRIDAKVAVEIVTREEVETSSKGPVEVRVDRVMHPAVSEDIPEPTQEGAVEVTYGTLGDLSTIMLERISELEWDNMRLRGNRNRGNKNRGNGNRGVNRNENSEGNDGNNNGNGYGNHNINPGGFMSVARDCTYQDFLKSQPLNFNEIKGVWNSHKRAIGIEAAYAMTWTELMKLLTEVYYPRNEIQKMEAKLWNLSVKGNDLTAYTGIFQKLNVIADEPTRLQDAIRITNNLMDQKLKGYARSAKNKRRFDNNPRENRGKQPAFKRKNVGGQNVTKFYMTGNNVRKGKDCPKLRNQNRGNKTGNKTGNKSGRNEGTSRAYAIRGGEANLDFNVVMVIVCDEKIVCIPYGDGMLIIRGDDCESESKSKLSIISYTKT